MWEQKSNIITIHELPKERESSSCGRVSGGSGGGGGKKTIKCKTQKRTENYY